MVCPIVKNNRYNNSQYHEYHIYDIGPLFRETLTHVRSVYYGVRMHNLASPTLVYTSRETKKSLENNLL